MLFDNHFPSRKAFLQWSLSLIISDSLEPVSVLDQKLFSLNLEMVQKPPPTLFNHTRDQRFERKHMVTRYWIADDTFFACITRGSFFRIFYFPSVESWNWGSTCVGQTCQQFASLSLVEYFQKLEVCQKYLSPELTNLE